MWRDRLKAMLWPILAKPWLSPVMETRFGLWAGVSALYSQSGRQLGEANTRPFILNHQIAAETLACKYEGSRAGRLINISALRIAMRHFDEALAITGAVRGYHHGRIGIEKPLGLWDLYIIARASIALIAFRQRSVLHRASGEPVPDALTSQYQFISGIFMICRDMIDRADPMIAQNRPVTAAELYAAADNHGIFISPNGMTCAGSTKKIMDFMTFCINGSIASESGANGVDLTAQPPHGLHTIVGAPDIWYQYALATVELDDFIELERLQQLRLAGAHSEEVLARSCMILSSMSHYCSQLVDSAKHNEHGPTFAGGVLARQNHILKLLGQSPITAISPKHLSERLGIAKR
jgi:hypothetical protein